MLTLGREQMSAREQAQTFVDGKIVYTPTGDPILFWGSVQPIGQATIQLLPEGSRRSARWQIFAEPPAPVLDMAKRYRITTSKGTMMLIGDVDNTGHTTGLPHVVYACAAVGADE